MQTEFEFQSRKDSPRPKVYPDKADLLLRVILKTLFKRFDNLPDQGFLSDDYFVFDIVVGYQGYKDSGWSRVRSTILHNFAQEEADQFIVDIQNARNPGRIEVKIKRKTSSCTTTPSVKRGGKSKIHSSYLHPFQIEVVTQESLELNRNVK